MTVKPTQCSKCSKYFVLEYGKPGLATECPECSPEKPLSPKEAREAALLNKSDIAEKLFQSKIREKREAEASRNWALANDLEMKIQELDKARIKLPYKPRS